MCVCVDLYIYVCIELAEETRVVVINHGHFWVTKLLHSIAIVIVTPSNGIQIQIQIQFTNTFTMILKQLKQ